MTLENILHEVANELGYPYEVCREAYYASWRFIRETAKQLPLQLPTEMSEEEYAKLRTSFNIPSLGKLACPYERYKNVNKRWQILKKYNKYTKRRKDNVQD